MNGTETVELQEAQKLAATAQVVALIALGIIAMNVFFQLGLPIANSLLNDGPPWRESVKSIGLIMISLLPTFLFYESVNRLRQALKLYGEANFFNSEAASRVARAGDYAISAMVAIMLVVPNLTRWVSHSGGFNVRLESEYIGMLAFALFVAAVGRILAAATKLKSENDSFV